MSTRLCPARTLACTVYPVYPVYPVYHVRPSLNHVRPLLHVLYNAAAEALHFCYLELPDVAFHARGHIIGMGFGKMKLYTQHRTRHTRNTEHDSRPDICISRVDWRLLGK